MKLKPRHTDVDALHRIDVNSASLPRHVPAGNTIVCHQMSLDLDQLTHILYAVPFVKIFISLLLIKTNPEQFHLTIETTFSFLHFLFIGKA